MAQRKPSFPEFGFVRLPQILACIPICESAWWEGCRTGRYPTTCVRNSISFSRHITRVRMCLTCGKIHETMEMRVDTKKLLAFVLQISSNLLPCTGQSSLMIQPYFVQSAP